MKKIIQEINEFHERIRKWFKNPIVIDLKAKRDNNKNGNMENNNNNSNVNNKQNVKHKDKKKS